MTSCDFLYDILSATRRSSWDRVHTLRLLTPPMRLVLKAVTASGEVHLALDDQRSLDREETAP